MKVKTLLVAAVMFVALSAAAFAQGTFQIGSIPVTTVTASGNTEKTGDITFTLLPLGNTTVDGTITVSYGVPITVDTALATTPIKIANANLVGAVAQPQILQVIKSGQVVIKVSSGATQGSFTLTGVRVAISGTSLTSLGATVSSTGNAILAGQTGVTVITSVAPALKWVGVDFSDSDKPLRDPATIVAIDPHSTSAVMSAGENYLAAFTNPPCTGVNIPAGCDLTATIGAMVKFTLSAAPPPGVSIVFPASTTSVAGLTWVLVDKAGATTTKTIKNDTTDLAVYYLITSSSDPTALEDITVSGIQINVASDIVKPVPAAIITYVASIAPIAPAFDSSGNPTGPIPRYDLADVGTGKLLTVEGSSTSLLVPYAVTVTAIGYNTGFAIANTTVDPAEDAIPQNGSITFDLYAQQNGATAPAHYSYTTSATSPGTGLDAAGLLPAGSIYTVLLSEILSAAGAPADFSGYAFISTNFTNAHAQYVISDFSGFTNGALALVIPSTANRAAGNETLGN